MTRYTPHPLGPGTPPGPGTSPRTRYIPPDQVHPPTPYDQVQSPTPWDQVHPLDQVHPPGTRYIPPGPGTPPGARHAGRYGQRTAVRILLECILVRKCFPKFSQDFLSKARLKKILINIHYKTIYGPVRSECSSWDVVCQKIS